MRSGPYDERPSIPIAVVPNSPAGGAGAIYLITHVDVAPTFKDATIDMLTKAGGDSRKEPGAVRFEAWQQSNRTNHFTHHAGDLEGPGGAVDGHVVAPSTREFREKLGPMMGALFDDRLYKTME